MRCYAESWYKYQIRIVVPALIFRDLNDRVVDEGLVRLTYGMDEGPPVNDTRRTKPKI